MTDRMQLRVEQWSVSLHCEGTKPTTSSAAALIQIAAYRIDLPQGTLENILYRLREECIEEEWQLKFMDSYNWQALGAPIGLVATVRSCLQNKATSTSPCSCGMDRFVSDETPKPTSSHILLSPSPAAPHSPDLKTRHSVPSFPSTRPSDDRIRSDSTHSMPMIPARRGTIVVDDALFDELHALSMYDSFAQISNDDFLSPAQIQERCMQTASSKQSRIGTSFNITDLFEDEDDDDEKSVGSFAGRATRSPAMDPATSCPVLPTREESCG
jgi:hypothetical protein